MKKKILYLCMISLFALFAFAACGDKENEEDDYNPYFDSSNYLSGYHYAQIDVQDYGSIIVALNADAAPATVTNFVDLVNQGFYDGLTFHRVIEGFMMQGGDPRGNGTGGSYYNIPGEFALNGYDNPLSHVRGVISMARAAENNDSASSQFFIVHENSTHLDGYYAAFGMVIDGMDVVDAICKETAVEDDNGTVLAVNQPVITSVSIVFNEESADAPLSPSANISFLPTTNTEELKVVDNWTITEGGKSYLLYTDEELLSVAIYETDLASGMTYDESKPLASFDNLGTGEFISVTINGTVGLPTHLLVTEEHDGAIGQYLVFCDAEGGDSYLVPVTN